MLVCALGLWFGFVFWVTPVWGLEYTKADTPTMHLTNDWVEGGVPGGGDTAVFDDTLSASNAASLELGTNITIGVLFFGNDMNGPVEISDTSGSGCKLTLAPSSYNGVGLDMSAANHDVTINTEIIRGNKAAIMLGGVGRTLTVGQSTSGAEFRISGNGGSLDVVSGSFDGGGYDSFFVGYSGTAIMNIRNAGTVVGAGDGTIRVGNTSSGTGTINVYDGKLNSRDTMYVGSGGGTGTVNVLGGEFYHDASYGDQIYVGDGSGGVGTITVSGGTMTLGRAGGYSGAKVQFGRNGGAGTLDINSGGTVVLNREFTGGFTLGTAGTGTINFNGGRVQTTWNRTLADTGVEYLVKAGGANVETTSGVTLTLATALLQSPVSPGGGLIKSGAGSLVLNGTNTYTGATTVSNGVLRLTHPQCLNRRTEVRIVSGASVDLAFEGENEIRELSVAGVPQGSGTYNAATPGMDGYLTGTGALRVGPSGAVLIVR